MAHAFMQTEVEGSPEPGGRVFGPFRVVAPLGRGGMATVYHAEHVETGERVALKTVNVVREKVVQGIRREVRALSHIQHPGIVRIVADGMEGRLPWYAMELIEGVTLGRLLQTDNTTTDLSGGDAEPSGPIGARLDFLELICLARAICPGLAYLHGEGLVHRDLKPDNIIRRDDGDPVLVDFGLASLSIKDRDATLTC